MNSAIQERVLAATMLCLLPLARVLLRSGINYRQFADVAKNAFLEEAAREPDNRGRKANVSRIAVRTGLSRKEVARIRDRRASAQLAGGDHGEDAYHSGHAARVLQFWHADARYVDAGGAPRDLSFLSDEVSFSSLVRLVGGDIPPGAVRAELVAAGAVTELPSGLLRPVKRYFVPGDVDEELVVGLTHIIHPVIEGLARNTDAMKGDPFVQRLAYSDRLIPAAIPLFRQVARGRCAEFVQSIDDWLSSNEAGPDVGLEEAQRVGVGVFYFEGQPPNARLGANQPAA
jgi:hypothetical protein